jgi:nicotinate-nucleotide--dimethylbenzimidazole phosphoribosyltransferase
MRLGEGTGAATAYGLVRSALATHNGMASFADAGVSEKRAR